MGFLTRQELAVRWKTSVRTIDRRRELGLIPWVDLAGGKGSRPCVRFKLSDIEQYEEKMTMNIFNLNSGAGKSVPSEIHESH
jgi:hypothetical protein